MRVTLIQGYTPNETKALFHLREMTMLVCDEDVSLERRRHSCSLLFPPFTDGLSRLSLSYQKLPPLLFKLTVRKLDNSSFDVIVDGTATVGELKQAVEDVFTTSPKEGVGRISWSHVWGHFCLSFEGQKLINNKDYIRNFVIKDGDELHFIQNLSMDYKLIRRQSRKSSAAYKPNTVSLTGSDVFDKEKEDADDLSCIYSNAQEENDTRYYYYKEEYKKECGEDIVGHSQFKLAPFLRGWLSYSRLWYVGKKRSEGKIRPSRFHWS